MTKAALSSQDEARQQKVKRTFKLFPYLHEDLKLYLLTFIADAPLECMPENYPHSALTFGLPTVSKKFHSFSNSDLYWKTALLRQLQREPCLWRKAMAQIIHSSSQQPEQEQQQHEASSSSVASERRHHSLLKCVSSGQLMERAHAALRSSDKNNTNDSCARTATTATYKSLYQHVVSHHLRFKGPVLCQSGHVQMGLPYETVVEQNLVHDILRRFAIPAREPPGPMIQREDNVLLIHANRGPLIKATPAVLTQILRCEPEQNAHDENHEENDNHHQRYTVILLPVGHVWLEKLWTCPKNATTSHDDDDDGLVYAQCLKMPARVTADMNRLARQEALTDVLTQLAEELLENHHMLDDDDDDDTDESSSEGDSLSEDTSSDDDEWED